MAISNKLTRRAAAIAQMAVSLLLVVALGSAIRADDTLMNIPENLHVAPELRPLTEALLERSSTFKSQCARIAAEPRLYVRATIDSRLEESTFRARSVIRRATDGAIVAFVYLPAFGDQIEWLAHEFEHVIEQLEGVRLGALATRQQGVWRSGRETFETARALAAGHAALDEARGRAGMSVRAARLRRERSGSGDD